MKMKSILFIILLFCIFNSFDDLIATAENETQSPEESTQIQVANEEYELKYPYPTTPPKPLKTFMDISTDGTSMSMRIVGTGAKTVVYKEKDSNVYHMGHCSYYAEKSNEDYSRPYWLPDIIMNGMRCRLCISEKTYYTCREAIYRTEVEKLSESNLVKQVQEQSWLIKILLGVTGILLICFIISVVKLLRYRKQELY